MMVDRNLVVTFANAAAEKLLSENRAAFREAYPSTEPGSFVGSTFDVFRGSDKDNGPQSEPRSTNVSVGELRFSVHISPLFDTKGKSLGTSLEWMDVTARRGHESLAAKHQGETQAIDKSLAVIAFGMDGTVLDVNDNFLAALGYEREEVVGKHHSVFVTEEDFSSPGYKELWAKLNRGEFDAGLYQRVRRDGRRIWIQASYSPVLGADGKPEKVVKYATDVTAAKADAADFQGQIEAISKSQAMITFEMDGTIVGANENFQQALNYTLEEIQGKHHSMFVEDRDSPEYAGFWAKLNRGEFHAGEYKRIGKNGREVWIQATYNPIRNIDGELFKVVKYATEVTEAKLVVTELQGRVDAISRAQAVISFEMDGTIVDANDNFLKTLGFELDEIVGKHHSMFVEDGYRSSAAYTEFWAALNRGEFDSGEYKRMGKGGKEVWIQATYNPIFDLNGKPHKVVKYATDISARVELQGELSRAVHETIRVANALADGDLTVSMEGTFEGQFGDLQASINRFIGSIGSTLGQAKSAATSVAQATEQLRASSSHLKDGASEQREACQSSSQALAETSSMVTATAGNASRANELAQATADAADEGSEKMGALTEAMSDIANSSQEIAKIIKVIDELAFQTNLLAVNAAVEAARAGRHGRGFAVVAQEVRSLAGRSAKAAQATADLIQGSTDTVARGVRNVEDTASSLTGIRDNVGKVRDLVGEISAACDEQSKGVSEITHAMNEVNTTAQGAQQQSSQLSSAASDLARLSDVLRDTVGKFTLAEPSGELDVSPELLRQLATLLKSNPEVLSALSAVNGPANSDPIVQPANTDGEERDARGYGSF
ncbi:MAG: PAS domain S-box protein [Nannocystaceae bacterium]|nr:PAS domain S-box protein [Nannocystaceae bacterium]